MRRELYLAPRIIQHMRAAFLILMIALLPLRGWLGDAMAMQMVTGHSVTTETIATQAGPIRAGATFFLNSATAPLPCHDAESAMGHPSEPGALNTTTASSDPASHSDCAQCSTCQVCHSVALFPVIRPLPLLSLPTQLMHSGHALFASVPRAPHLKPPIS